MKKYLLALALLAVPTLALAQVPPVKNPTKIMFTSADHAQVTDYEIDIKAGTTVVQTLTVPKGKTVVNAQGEVEVDVNVQPITFGSYTFVARAVVMVTKSNDSVPSDPWERAPGQPSKPRAQ